MLKYLLVLLLTISLLNAKCYKKDPDTLKVYKVNLDLPPRDRFTHVNQFTDALVRFVHFQKSTINPLVFKLVEFIASDLDNYLPYPFNEELKGLSDATGIDLGDVVLMNLLYDVRTFCTSIIAQDANGKIIHGRNLDYYYQNYMTNLTYIAQYIRNGELLFTSIQSAGYIGILTAHKHNAFTFSINERDAGSWIINLLFGILDKTATPLAFLTRHVMENATDFLTAEKMLSTTHMIAPSYMILGGIKPYEGVVITRNQDKVIDYWRLDASSKGIESWFLLETNHDHWVGPSKHDNRSTVGIEAMNSIGQKSINSETLLDVLTIKPVCNNFTIYSVYMSAIESDSVIQTMIRY